MSALIINNTQSKTTMYNYKPVQSFDLVRFTEFQHFIHFLQKSARIDPISAFYPFLTKVCMFLLMSKHTTGGTVCAEKMNKKMSKCDICKSFFCQLCIFCDQIWKRITELFSLFWGVCVWSFQTCHAACIIWNKTIRQKQAQLIG